MQRFGLISGPVGGLIAGLKREVCFTPTVTSLVTAGAKKADLFRDKQPCVAFIPLGFKAL